MAIFLMIFSLNNRIMWKCCQITIFFSTLSNGLFRLKHDCLRVTPTFSSFSVIRKMLENAGKCQIKSDSMKPTHQYFPAISDIYDNIRHF